MTSLSGIGRNSDLWSEMSTRRAQRSSADFMPPPPPAGDEASTTSSAAGTTTQDGSAGGPGLATSTLQFAQSLQAGGPMGMDGPPPPPSDGDAQGGDDAGGGDLRGLLQQLAPASDTDGDGELSKSELGTLKDTLATALENALKSLGDEGATETSADASGTTATATTSNAADASTTGSGSGDAASQDGGGGDSASSLASRLAAMMMDQYSRFSGLMAHQSSALGVDMAA